MELADVSDSKSDGSDTVPVRPRSSALIFCLKEYYKGFWVTYTCTKFNDWLIIFIRFTL